MLASHLGGVEVTGSRGNRKAVPKKIHRLSADERSQLKYPKLEFAGSLGLDADIAVICKRIARNETP